LAPTSRVKSTSASVTSVKRAGTPSTLKSGGAASMRSGAGGSTGSPQDAGSSEKVSGGVGAVAGITLPCVTGLSEVSAFAGDEVRVALEGCVIEVSGAGMRMGKAYLPPVRPGSDCSPGRHLSVSPGQGGRFRQEGALPGCTHVRRVSCRKRGGEANPDAPRRGPRAAPRPAAGPGQGRYGSARGDAAAKPAAKIFCTAMSTPVRLSPAITPAATTMRNAALHFGA